MGCNKAGLQGYKARFVPGCPPLFLLPPPPLLLQRPLLELPFHHGHLLTYRLPAPFLSNRLRTLPACTSACAVPVLAEVHHCFSFSSLPALYILGSESGVILTIAELSTIRAGYPQSAALSTPKRRPAAGTAPSDLAMLHVGGRLHPVSTTHLGCHLPATQAGMGISPAGSAAEHGRQHR